MYRSFRRILFGIAIVLLSLIASTRTGMAQPLTPSLVQQRIKEWIAAWEANDPGWIARVDPPIDGFGYRTLKARSSATSPAEYLNSLRAFFAGMDYYRVELNDLQTKVDGNIGLAWGFYTEHFKRKGHAPEEIRIRFTRALRFDQGNWQTLLHHADIQQFDEKGNYLASK